jgi:hypothetical protein
VATRKAIKKMGTLKEDIQVQSEWMVKAFMEDHMYLDYSIGSLMDVDRFFIKHTFRGQAVKGGRLMRNTGPILFGIGAYLGNCILQNVKGAKWVTDDDDPHGEINISIEFSDGTIIWPMQRVMKRFRNGSEDSIYVYGHRLTEAYTKEEFDSNYWNLKERSKAWWKFW